MVGAGFEVYSFSDRPDLAEAATSLDLALPEFMGHDAVQHLYWRRLCEEFADFQFSLSVDGAVIAAGYTVPATFGEDDLPDRGWDAALEGAFTGVHEGSQRGSLCALLAVVSPEARGGGVSRHILRAMKELAARHGFERLIAPVRPSLKALYPLTEIERYIEWRREDGLLFDPWMRVHERLGAGTVKVAPRSMEITGTVAQWESWTDMRLPESGEYVVEGALVPVEVDVERDVGTYVEPNVWTVHAL